MLECGSLFDEGYLFFIGVYGGSSIFSKEVYFYARSDYVVFARSQLSMFMETCHTNYIILFLIQYSF